MWPLAIRKVLINWVRQDTQSRKKAREHKIQTHTNILYSGCGIKFQSDWNKLLTVLIHLLPCLGDRIYSSASSQICRRETGVGRWFPQRDQKSGVSKGSNENRVLGNDTRKKVCNKLAEMTRFRHWLAMTVSQPGDLEINGNSSLWRYSGLRVNGATPCYIQQLSSCACSIPETIHRTKWGEFSITDPTLFIPANYLPTFRLCPEYLSPTLALPATERHT